MSKVTVGKKVPDFTLPATGEQDIALSDFKGKNVVVYFYPKDSTPGCTAEACNLRNNYNRLTVSSFINLVKDCKINLLNPLLLRHIEYSA